MNRFLSAGGYVWTFCAAGWLVIGIVHDNPAAFVLGLACIGMSALCHWASKL